jgi:hypothetical protein
MYVLKVATDHKYCNRYEFLQLVDHNIQPPTDFSNWSACPSIKSWNWDIDAGFELNLAPTSPMTFAFMKIKEEYRGKNFNN